MKTILVLVIILQTSFQLREDSLDIDKRYLFAIISFYLAEEDWHNTLPILNTYRSINVYNSRVNLNFVNEILLEDDLFKCKKVFCALLEKHPRMVAIFVSETKSSSVMIQSITAELNIPYFQTSWLQQNSYLGRENAINFYPDFDLVSTGLAKIVESLHWKSFTVLYEDFDGILKLQEIIKLQKMEDLHQRHNVIIKKLDFSKDIRSTLKEIKHSGERRIVIDCKISHAFEVLERAKEVGMMTFAYNYFLSSMDAHTLNLKVLNADANITTVRMIDPEDKHLRNVVEKWNHPDYPDSYSVKTETMFIQESISLLVDAVSDIVRTKNVTLNNVSCTSEEKFNYGPHIISYMNSRYTSPAARSLVFDEKGKRMDFTLYLIEGNREKIIATWNSLNPDVVNFIRTAEESYKKRVETLQTRVQNVSSRLQAPYLMLKKNHEKLFGNDKYEGYVFDLMTKIAEKLNFQFSIQISNSNGNCDEAVRICTGVIGDILNEKAQFGIGDMTITPARESVIDFSMPFMRLGIGILLQKPKTTVSMFAFLNPFSAEVWMYTATLYLTVSIILYFVARMAPGDWENPHPCNLNPNQLENLWSINNCMWLTMGSIMNQGSDILPKGISSRLVTSMWWFFALIMTNSYIASLAAFLTVKGIVIDDLEDLAKQNKIKYGALESGSTQDFFRQSNYSTYRRMYANMVLNVPSVFVETTLEGVHRVQSTPDGTYAFLMESTTIDYLVERDCTLTTVNKWFNNIEYGIAMPPDSPYRTAINDAILELQENGVLTVLKNKWWRVEYETACVTPNESAELKLENVGGIFVVLGIGLAIALLLGILEFFWTVRQTSVEEHISYWKAFKTELLFALKVWISKKKAKRESNRDDSLDKSNNDRASQWHMEQSEERQTG